MSKININAPQIERDAYYDNQAEIVSRFSNLLASVEKVDTTNMSRNFPAWALFTLIRDQVAFIKHLEKGLHPYGNLKAERAILAKFEEAAKNKFGKFYDEWMKREEKLLLGK